MNIDSALYEVAGSEMLDYLLRIAASLGENEVKEVRIRYNYDDYLVLTKADSLRMFPINDWCPKCGMTKVRSEDTNCYLCAK